MVKISHKLGNYAPNLATLKAYNVFVCVIEKPLKCIGDNIQRK